MALGRAGECTAASWPPGVAADFRGGTPLDQIGAERFADWYGQQWGEQAPSTRNVSLDAVRSVVAWPVSAMSDKAGYGSDLLLGGPAGHHHWGTPPTSSWQPFRLAYHSHQRGHPNGPPVRESPPS